MNATDKQARTEQKIAWIRERIAEGLTVSFATALRVTQFSPRNSAKLEAAGFPFVKVGSDGCLLMIEGFSGGKPRYVDADGCRVTAS